MKYPKYALLAGLLYGLSTLPAVAGTVSEADVALSTSTTGDAPNIIGNATTEGANQHPLPVDGSDIQISGWLDLGDVDVYALDVQAGDVVTFDIDCGDACGTSIDTQLTVIDGADMSVLGSNDDSGVVDTGSNSDWDPFINVDPNTGTVSGIPMVNSGRIYVVVTQGGATIDSSGGDLSVTFMDGGSGVGDYQLIISGVTVASTTTTTPTTTGTSEPTPVPEPATTDSGDQIINVNINPFYKGRWPRINPRSRGVIPVAILSQDGVFDPADLVLQSLKFGKTGQEDSLVRCQSLHRDLNRDGVDDLLCFFSMRKANFDSHSESAILTGTLQNGTGITGQATLKMVPYKRHRHGSRSSYGGNRGHGHGRR